MKFIKNPPKQPKQPVEIQVSSIPATHDSIAERAYALWLSEGRPSNRELEHWLQAEAQG
jgi:hypothetical protein